MAEIAVSSDAPLPNATDVRKVQWGTITNGDTTSWVECPNYGMKSIHVFGTFGGATAILQGSNEDTPTNAFGIVSLTANGGGAINVLCRWIRVAVTGGAGSSLTPIALFRKHS